MSTPGSKQAVRELKVEDALLYLDQVRHRSTSVVPLTRTHLGEDGVQRQTGDI
jgi:hypothetical protein